MPHDTERDGGSDLTVEASKIAMPDDQPSVASTTDLESSPERPSPLLTLSAAAEYLSTSERHVRRLASDRRLTYVKIGGRIRLRLADLDAYIEANTFAPLDGSS